MNVGEVRLRDALTRRGFLRFKPIDQESFDGYVQGLRELKKKSEYCYANDRQSVRAFVQRFAPHEITHQHILFTNGYNITFSAFPLSWNIEQIYDCLTSEMTGEFPNLITDQLDIEDFVVACVLCEWFLYVPCVDIAYECIVEKNVTANALVRKTIAKIVSVVKSRKPCDVVEFLFEIQRPFGGVVFDGFVADSDMIDFCGERLERHNDFARRYIADKLIEFCMALFPFALPDYVLLEMSGFVRHINQIPLKKRYDIIFAVNRSLQRAEREKSHCCRSGSGFERWLHSAIHLVCFSWPINVFLNKE